MRREFSAGGVVVRRLRGGWHVAAIRPGGKAGVWALPKGLIGAGERARRTPRRARWRRRPALDGPARREARATSATSTRGTASASSRSSASTSSATGGRLGDDRARARARGGRGALAPARGGAGAARLRRRARDGATGRSSAWPSNAGGLTVHSSPRARRCPCTPSTSTHRSSPTSSGAGARRPRSGSATSRRSTRRG